MAIACSDYEPQDVGRTTRIPKEPPLSDKQKPQLSTSLFAKKKKQLLFLKSKPDVKESTDGSATVRQSTTTSPFEIGHVLLADRNTLKELKRILAR